MFDNTFVCKNALLVDAIQQEREYFVFHGTVVDDQRVYATARNVSAVIEEFLDCQGMRVVDVYLS